MVSFEGSLPLTRWPALLILWLEMSSAVSYKVADGDRQLKVPTTSSEGD